MDKYKALYIHIPFCRSKCHYCDFNSQAGKEHIMAPYFNALKKEMRMYSPQLADCTVSSVFIGGGTPSLAAPELISKLMEDIGDNFNVGKAIEVSIESNPGTLSIEKLKAYRECGINRLSIGLQACQDSLLKYLGRIHTYEDYVESIENAQKTGFENINADLIFGIPGQTIGDWDETLSKALKTAVTHLSCYSLKIEEGTMFGDRLESGLLTPADDDLDRNMYGLAKEKLSDAGFLHYEISNFSLPGYECKHNITYWRALEYLGLGAGAHSYISGVRFNNIYSPEEYIGLISSGASPAENHQPIGREESMSEFAVLGLRLVEGLSVPEFQDRFGEDIFKRFGPRIEGLVKKGLLEVSDNMIKLTPTGLDLANQVFLEFLQ
jgi:oxygen-independent coproporphyrinogen-3 oxidase